MKLAEMPANVGASAEKSEEGSGGAASALEGVSVEASKGHGVTVTDVEQGQSGGNGRVARGRHDSRSEPR